MNGAFDYAQGIVAKLVRSGHLAYFAGGWVRDYVMGHPSEDIDIATNASPAEIMDLFPQTVLVGLSFGVVIVVIEGHSFEVATFRKDLHYIDGRHPQGIEMSTPLEDAKRRDFTMNGMFYDPIENKIIDYVNGQEDIRLGLIRTIGDPHERFFEDRLRILRAFRFSSRFSFTIEQETQEAIREHANKLFPAVAMERVWQELNKMAAYPRFDQAIVDMHRLSLLEVIFPEVIGMHLKELREHVHAYSHFPKGSPTIAYLMEFLPGLSLDQKIEIVKRLKAPHKNITFLEYLEQISRRVRKERETATFDLYQWTHLFAHPAYELALPLLAARYPDEQERATFLQYYWDCLKRLAPHVERVRQGRPLVSATFLQAQGIQPGRKMGVLLREAEKIAIEENKDDPFAVLEKLRLSPVWNQP